jgi:RsiW-degrading membrane proteinase PrsW (M82 family)/ribosomal protein S18 acetylase RimI-like enzyme
MNLLALAIAPGLAICLFIFHRDAYNREPKRNLIFSFFLGAASIVPAVYIEKYFYNVYDTSIAGLAVNAFLVVAMTEELCKFAALRLYAYPRKSFDEPLDGIVYGVMVSMGFATVENILYVQQGGVSTAILRMFLSVPAHATFGVLMGYFVGKAKFDPNRSVYLTLAGLFWAVFFHGTYDVLLFWQQSPKMEDYVSDILLFLGAVISFIVALRLSFKHIKIHRRLSQRTHMPTASLSIRGAQEKDIPLIQDLTNRVWPQTYASILPQDKIDYMMKLMYSTESLQQQMKKGSQFVVVYDELEPVGFASIEETETGIFKLHKIYVLPSQQGKGTGRYIIDELIKRIKPRGGKAIHLQVNRNNLKAKGFYEKLGFSVIEEINLDIGGGFFMDDYVMELKL